MSITDHKRPKSRRDTGAGEDPAGAALFRRPLVIGAAMAVVLALVVAGIVLVVTYDSKPKINYPAATAPITLPDTMTGLAAGPRDSDFANQPLWLSKAKAAAPGAVVVGRGYGSVKLRRQIRAVAGRADLTGQLEFAWAADAGRTVKSPEGDAHCTQNLILAPGSEASVRPTVMLCWRTSAELSAYGVVIDFDHDPTDAQGMAVLDTTWKAALTGR